MVLLVSASAAWLMDRSVSLPGAKINVKASVMPLCSRMPALAAERCLPLLIATLHGMAIWKSSSGSYRSNDMTRLATLAEIKRERERTETRLYEMALSLIERQARKILVAHPSLDEFVMAMGGWLFTRRDIQDDISTVYREYIPAYAMPFTRMMDEFDRLELKVTGEPMRFTARGPIVREWGGTDGLNGVAVAVKYGRIAL